MNAAIRIRGPVTRDRLAPYCIAVAVHFPTPANPNRQRVNCKVCGVRIEKGAGQEAIIRGLGRYFLCADCTLHVESCRALFLGPPETVRYPKPLDLACAGALELEQLGGMVVSTEETEAEQADSGHTGDDARWVKARCPECEWHGRITVARINAKAQPTISDASIVRCGSTP